MGCGHGQTGFSQISNAIKPERPQSPTIKPTLELVFKRIHPDDIAFVRQTLDHATYHKANLDFEHRLLMPGRQFGQMRPRLAQPAKTAAGALEFVGAVMDITEKKKSEDALNAAKARFEGILEIAEDAIISVDSNQRILLFNQGAEKVFGYAQAEVIGKSLDLLLPQRFAQAHRSHIEGFAKSGGDFAFDGATERGLWPPKRWK